MCTYKTVSPLICGCWKGWGTSFIRNLCLKEVTDTYNWRTI